MAVDGGANEELIAAVNGVVYPLSREECVFRASATGDKHVMTLQVLQALDLCSRFRTLDEHVAAVMNAISELKGRDEDVLRVLGFLQKRKLFVSARDVLEGFRVEAEQAAPLAGLFVRSAGRPECLDRLLKSYADRRADPESYPACFVVDDATDPDASGACEAVCERWRKQGVAVRWLGTDWQRSLIDRLTERLPDAETAIRLLLARDDAGDGFTGGRAWNLITLAASGRRLLMVDDDIVLQSRQLDGGGGVEVDAPDRWDLWFYRDADSVAHAGEALEADPVALHETHLGRPIGAAVRVFADQPALLAGMDQRRLESLAVKGPVIATISGVYGDAASAGNLWYFTATGESRERFWRSREDYDSFRRTRWVARSRRRASIQRRASFTPVGLDASHLLPPVLPDGRNEDFLFNVMLARMHPRARTLELPWALGHFPEAPRDWQMDALKQPHSPSFGRFLGDFLLNLASGAPVLAPEDALGDALARIAALADESDGMLRSRLDEYLMYARSDIVRRLQQRIAENPQAPVYWAADVRRIIELNGKALTGNDAPRLAGTPERLPDADYIAWVRDRLRRFAKAARHWPAMMQAAREIEPLPR